MSPTSPDLYIAAQNGAVRLAVRDLRKFWGRIDHLDALGKRKALEDYWPLLVGRYGEVTATLAADRFEELTGASAVLADPLPGARVNARMRWAVTPLFGGSGDAAAIGLLAQLADELIKQPGRDTMLDSARRHGVKVARVPTGAETCAWCLMLASRGWAYASKDTALAANHGDCDCRIAIEGEPTPGYDPDALYDAYFAASRDAGSTSAKKVLAAMREREGLN